MEVMHRLVLDINRPWGHVCTDWQRDNAQAVLTATPAHPVRLFWFELPKGSSKTTDTAAMSIVWLLTQARLRDEGYVCASDAEQATRLLNRAKVIINKSGLGQRLKILGDRIVNVTPVPTGISPGDTVEHSASIQALSADAPGAEGILSPWVIVDELVRWKDTENARGMWRAMFSGHPKVPGARLIVISHAGDPAHWSYKIRERARVSDRWKFTHVDGPTPWMDPSDLDEQQALLLPSDYRQRFLNEWVSGEDRLASREDVMACVGDYETLDPQAGVRYVTAVDIGLVFDRTSVTIGHREGGMAVVDRVHTWQGTAQNPVSLDAVEAWLTEVHREYPGRIYADPWQAAHLIQRLKARGIAAESHTFTQHSNGRLAVTLFRAIKDHSLRLPSDNELIEEIVNARLRQTSPGMFRIDHDADKHDDRVITLALVCDKLVRRPAGQGHVGGRYMSRASIIPRPRSEQERKALARETSPWRRNSVWSEPIGTSRSRSLARRAAVASRLDREHAAT